MSIFLSFWEKALFVKLLSITADTDIPLAYLSQQPWGLEMNKRTLFFAISR